MNTLITGASTARAHQIKRDLNKDHVLLGDYRDLPDVMLKSGRMMKLPNPQGDTYPHQMLALCLDNQINEVYLLQAEEVQQLQPAEQLFTEYDIKLVAAYA